MKTCFFLFLFLTLPQAWAAERFAGEMSVLSSEPATAAGRVWNKPPATEAARKIASENRKLFENVSIGQRFIIQNSVYEFDDEVVTVSDIFEDGSVRVKRPSGKKASIPAKHLAAILSPEIPCGESHGEKICKGDMIFYPIRTTSLMIPEAPVEYLFENGSVVVKDGGEFVFDLKQVGKPKECSPQRENICVGDYVFAESYRADEKFTFEGPVEKTYSHGIALIKVSNQWRYPIDIHALKKRIASDDPAQQNPAVITSHGSRGKDLPYKVTPELEPLDPGLVDKANDAR